MLQHFGCNRAAPSRSWFGFDDSGILLIQTYDNPFSKKYSHAQAYAAKHNKERTQEVFTLDSSSDC
eukprot:6035711-Amphidinium_carterae.1